MSGDAGVPTDVLTPKLKTTFIVGEPPLPLLEAQNPPRYPLSSKDIRSESSTLTLTQHVVKALDDDIPLPMDIAKSLLCHAIEDFNSQYIYPDNVPPFTIPWPEPVKQDNSDYSVHQVKGAAYIKNKDEGKSLGFKFFKIAKSNLRQIFPTNEYSGNIVEPGQSKTFPKGVKSGEPDGDFNPLLHVSIEAIAKMKPHEQDELIHWVFDKLIDNVSEPGDLREEILPEIFWLIRTSPNKSRLMWHAMNYVHTHSDNYHYKILLKEDEREYGFGTAVDEVAWRIGRESSGQEEGLKYIASMDNDETRRKFLGILIDNTSFVDTLNGVRRLLRDTENAQNKNQFERLGKMLLGFDPDDRTKTFHTGLDTFYNAVDLNKMDHLNAATEFDLKVIKDTIAEYALEDDLKVIVGCGKGRHTNPLARDGIRGLVGIDIVKEEVEEAKKADTTNSVNYHTGDWDDMSEILPTGSAGFYANIGRNLTHVEKKEKFKTAVKETARILGKGKYALIDMPDNNSGLYRVFRQRLMGILKSLGIPFDKLGDEETALSYIEHTVDNPFPNDPTTTDWMNRYTPSESTITEVLKEYGLQVVKKFQDEIKGWGGAQNVYYVAQKI